MKQRKTGFGFTLIELLVVIGIIGILAAILLPAIKAAIEKANKSQAQSEATGIANAIKAFYNEYSRYPAPAAEPADSQSTIYGISANQNYKMVVILTASETATPFKNSKKIPFLEMSSSSTNSTGGFVDPWDQEYHIACDFNFDNKVSTGGSHYNDLAGRGIAVWSLGPDGKSGTADDPKSW